MHTIARILVPLLLATGLLAGAQGTASADVARDYDSLTRKEAIEALKVADANVATLTTTLVEWQEYNRANYQLAGRMESERNAARRDLLAEQQAHAVTAQDAAYWRTTSDYWEHYARTLEEQRAHAAPDATAAYWERYARTLEAEARAAHRQIARRDARIAVLVAKVAALKAAR